MDRDDYERRKAALEEIYRADLDLVRAAHEARLSSLEALRLAEAPASSSKPVPPPAPTRQPTPHLRTALEEILPDLPIEFEKKDVIAALSWTPSRGALYRVLLDLAVAGVIEIDPSLGRHPSRYRKLK